MSSTLLPRPWTLWDDGLWYTVYRYTKGKNMPLSAFFFGSILGVSASRWYLSRLNGTIEDGCGLVKSHPCKYIYQVTTLAHEGDVINIDGLGNVT